MTEPDDKFIPQVPRTFAEALQYTPIPVLPLHFASEKLHRPEISSNPSGLILPTIDADQDNVDDDTVLGWISSQDVSYLSFELSKSSISDAHDVNSSSLSPLAKKFLEKCEFKLQQSLPDQPSLPSESSLTSPVQTMAEIDMVEPRGAEKELYPESSIPSVEDPRSKEERLRADFADMADLLLLHEHPSPDIVEIIHGRPFLRFSFLNDLYRVVSVFENLGELTSIADNDELQAVCKMLVSFCLAHFDLSAVVQQIETQSTEAPTSLDKTESAMVACSILVSFLTSSLRSYKKPLFSEETCISIVVFLMKCLDEVIFPAIKEKRSQATSIDLSINAEDVVHQLTRIIDSFTAITDWNNLPETAITKLEFLTLRVLFTESSVKEDVSLIKPTSFESLGVSCMQLVSKIFECLQDQRSFIFEEVINNVSRMGTHANRTYRIADRVTVQPLTAILINFIQITSAAEFPAHDHHFSALDDKSMNKLAMKTIRSSVREGFVNSQKVIEFLTDKAGSSTKSDDAPYQKLLGLLVHDLTELIKSPQCPAAEILLYTLIWRLIDLSELDTGMGGNGLAAELLGFIACRLPIPPKLGMRFIELSNFSREDFDKYCRATKVVCAYLSGAAKKYFTTRYMRDLDLMALNELYEGGTDDDESEEPSIVRPLAVKALDECLPQGYEWHRGMLRTTLEEATEAYRIYLSMRPIARCYDLIIRSLLNALSSKRVARRSRALKSITAIMETNTEVFALQNVQQALCDNIVHSSTQVRDSAVDVVGKFILLQPTFIPSLIPLICDRSNDTGTAVRKRIVKLLKDVFYVTGNFQIRTTISECILWRLEDIEPNIVTEAMGILTQFLFYPPHSAADDDHWAMTLLLSLNNQNSRLLAVYLAKCLRQLRGEDSTLELVDRQYVFGKCRSIVNTAMDSLCDAADIYPTIRLLSLMASSNGALVQQDHLLDLEPYMIDEEQTSSRYYALIFVRSGLEFSGNSFSRSFIKELQTLLLSQLAKYSVKELHEGVRCLAVASRKLDDYRTLALTLSSCFDALNQISTITILDQRLARLIHLVSNIARHCDEKSSSYINSRGKSLKSDIRQYSVNNLLRFTDISINDKRVKSLAIRAIGNICISNPKIFFDKKVLILFDRVMGLQNNKDDIGDFEEKSAVLRVLLDMHLEENERESNGSFELEKHPAKRRKIGKWLSGVDMKRLNGTSSITFKDGASVGLVQRYLSQVLEIALISPQGSNLIYVMNAIRLIEQICRQGFAHPRTCVPTVMALGASHIPEISSIARNTLSVLYSKYKSVIDGSYVDSVKVVYQYCQSNGEPAEGALDAFYSVVNESRPVREKFFTVLVKSLEFDAFKSEVDFLFEHLNYCIFVFKAVSSLPLTTYGEVSKIIQAIEWHMVTTGTELWGRVEEDDEEEPDPAIGVSTGIFAAMWKFREFMKDSYDLSDGTSQGANGPLKAKAKVKAKLSKTDSVDLDGIETRRGAKHDLTRVQLFRDVMEKDNDFVGQEDSSDEEFN